MKGRNPRIDITPVEYTDFRNVLFIVWQALGLPEPTTQQMDMADALQNVVKPMLGLPVDPDFKTNFPNLVDDEGAPCMRLILEAFRGIGKSWITGVLVPWCHFWDAELNVMVVSASKKKADGFSTFAKKVILEIPMFQHLEPDIRAGARWSNVAFDVAGAKKADQDASVYSISVFGAMTGGRGDLIIADDVEVPNTSETMGMREKLEERVRETESIIKPGGVIVFLGTPQTEDTLYKKLEIADHRRVVWPARMPNANWMKHHGYTLSARFAKWRTDNPDLQKGFGVDGKSGAPSDAKRFNDEDLNRREMRYGRTGFALQFMLDTSLSDADRFPLKLRDFIVADLNKDIGPSKPSWTSDPARVDMDLPCVGFQGDRWFRQRVDNDTSTSPYQGRVMSIDPAGRGKDEMSYAVVYQLNGFLYVMEVKGILGDGYSEDSLKLLAAAAKRHNVSNIIVESNFGDGMFTELLKPVMKKVHPCAIDEVRHSKQKEARIIDTLEPMMNQHRIVVDASVIHADRVTHEDETAESGLHRQLFHQLTRITRERGALRHDDRLDALSMAVAYWVDSAALDADDAMDAAERKAMKERLKFVLTGRARSKGTKEQSRLGSPEYTAKRRKARGRTGANWLNGSR
jgi:hypothetical protein